MATASGNITEDDACMSSSDDIERVSNIEATEDVRTDRAETQVQTTREVSGRSGQEGDVDPDAERVVNEFTTKTWREDLTLIVEGKELYVNSVALDMVSPVFSSMIETTFRTEGTKGIELPGNYDDLVEFLRCIYPSVMKPVSEDNVLKVAPLIHTYQVDRAEKACEEVLLRMVRGGASPESLCSVLNVASSCQMASLRETCIAEITKRRTSVIDAAMDEVQLSADEKLEIKKSKNELLEEDVKKLTLQVQREKSKYTELETHVRNLLMSDVKISDIKGVEFRVIDLKSPGRSQPVSKTILIKQITWNIVICHNWHKSDPVTVRVSATGDQTWRSWECKARISCSISDGNHCLWQQDSLENVHLLRQVAIRISASSFSDFNLNGRLKAHLVLVVGDISCKL